VETMDDKRTFQDHGNLVFGFHCLSDSGDNHEQGEENDQITNCELHHSGSHFHKFMFSLKCRKMQKSKGWMVQGLLVLSTTMHN